MNDPILVLGATTVLVALIWVGAAFWLARKPAKPEYDPWGIDD